MKSEQAGQRRGFSLVELMVSMGIGSVILLVAVSLLGATGDGYERVGGGVGAEREARALLNQLAADLSTAVHHEDTLFESGGGAWAVDRLGFLALQPEDAQSPAGRVGDLCAVTYYVRDLEMGGKTVRCLMRGFRESAETLAAVRDGTLADLLAREDPADDAIAFGVVGFEARPVVRGTDGVTRRWSSTDGGGPGWVEVRLVVARRELAAKLATASDWDRGGSAGRLAGDPAQADRNSGLEVYSTFIRFGHHGNP
jgi:prepilin-type N-terminal cleavage/methylation domain-containing protein